MNPWYDNAYYMAKHTERVFDMRSLVLFAWSSGNTNKGPFRDCVMSTPHTVFFPLDTQWVDTSWVMPMTILTH